MTDAKQNKNIKTYPQLTPFYIFYNDNVLKPLKVPEEINACVGFNTKQQPIWQHWPVIKQLQNGKYILYKLTELLNQRS